MSRKTNTFWMILEFIGIFFIMIPLGLLYLLCYPFRKLLDEVGKEELKEFKSTKNDNSIDENGKKRN